MRSRSRLGLLALPLLLAAGACSDGAVSARRDAGGDGAASDASAADAASADAATCDFPAPLVAGTVETDALADAPARCGQGAYRWLRGSELGAIVSAGEPRVLRASLLNTLLAVSGVSLPEPLQHDSAVQLITYRTQDRGQLIEATAVVAYPNDSTPGAALDMLLLLHGTSGFTDGCGVGGDEATQLLGAALASYGRVVVIPDFLGLRSDGEKTGFLHPYLAGQPTAIAALDALRAAAQLAPSQRGGVCARPRFVTFGGSQGGHAALWVERLAPYYARELEHLGGVATVPPADLLRQSERALRSLVDASKNAVAFLGTVPFWYGVGARLDEVFAEPWPSRIPALLGAGCDLGDAFRPTALEEVFSPGVLSAAAEDRFAALDPWGCIVRENGLTTTSVARLGQASESYGMLFVTGEADQLVNTPIERESFATLCSQGLPLQYLECRDAGHTKTTLWALPELLRFVDDRLAQRALPAATRCVLQAPSRCENTPAAAD
ncbi:MAG: hypothetical protein IPL40_00060 [Proteobacteria bacterium]|nr:hypothetical protein [Pseudomonadota bacterium]